MIILATCVHMSSRTVLLFVLLGVVSVVELLVLPLAMACDDGMCDRDDEESAEDW
jgi:hypothetical protein